MTFEDKVEAVKQMIAAGKPLHEIEDKLDFMDDEEQNESQASQAVA